MRRFALPLFYLALVAAALCAPIYAVTLLFETKSQGFISTAEAETTAAAPAAAPAARPPVWIAPTKQYNYAPPALPKAAPQAPVKKEAKKPARKPAQEARKRRVIESDAAQAFAAAPLPEPVLNRD